VLEHIDAEDQVEGPVPVRQLAARDVVDEDLPGWTVVGAARAPDTLGDVEDRASAEACRRGKRVRYFNAENLATAIVEAKAHMQYGKLQRQLERADVVVVDELGYVSLSRESAQALFHFFSERHERRSVIITTNLEFGKWTEVFGEERMTAALLDRITHKAHIFLATGESYRFRDSQKRKHGAKGRADKEEGR